MMMTITAITTNGGPHGHVQDALNLSSLRGRPCLTQARRNLQLARPIDNHAILGGCCQYMCCSKHGEHDPPGSRHPQGFAANSTAHRYR